MNALQTLKSHLKPGHVYRRTDLEKWSNAIDRHLNQLQKESSLLKFAAGMYYCPKETPFGKARPHDYDLIEVFLKDSRFLFTTPNAYNALRVGTTLLYNEAIIYNHKRHGRFKLGNRDFRFVMKHHFPLELSDEFLLVDLIDNLSKLAEDREKILNLVKAKTKAMNSHLLRKAVKNYGGTRAKKFFATLLMDESIQYGA